jgi:hypothetical protein
VIYTYTYYNRGEAKETERIGEPGDSNGGRRRHRASDDEYRQLTRRRGDDDDDDAFVGTRGGPVRPPVRDRAHFTVRSFFFRVVCFFFLFFFFFFSREIGAFKFEFD